jgi:hypothetical protein
MTQAPIRQFNVVYGRSGEITQRVICNGRRHFDSQYDKAIHEVFAKHCDGRSCAGPDAMPVAPESLGFSGQYNVGLRAAVPAGHVLAVITTRTDHDTTQLRVFNHLTEVAIGELASGLLLPPTTGTFIVGPTYDSCFDELTFVRNPSNGIAETKELGKANGRWSTSSAKRKRKALMKQLSGSLPIMAYQQLIDQLQQAETILRQHPESEARIHIARIKRIMSGLLRITIHEAATGQATQHAISGAQAETIGVQLEVLEHWLGHQGLL